MDKIKLFHLADVHLDGSFSSLYRKPNLAKQRRDEILSSFLNVLEQAKKQDIQFILIAGDLFEQDSLTSKTIQWLTDGFSSIPDIKIIMISGNHDMESSQSFYQTISWPRNVYFLGQEQSCVYFEKENVNICGLGFGPGHGNKEKLHQMVVKPQALNILLFHGDIDIDVGERDYNQVRSQTLAEKNFDYVACGHHHNKKEDIGKYGVIYNPGSLEPLGFDEEGEHGYFTVSLQKGHPPEVAFQKHAKTSYVQKKVDISKMDNVSQTMKRIEERIENDQDFYHIKILGQRNFMEDFDPRFIEKRLMEKHRYVLIDDQSEILLTHEQIGLMKGLKGIFAKQMLEKIQQAENDVEKSILNKALYYGIQAIDDENVQLQVDDL